MAIKVGPRRGSRRRPRRRAPRRPEAGGDDGRPHVAEHVRLYCRGCMDCWGLARYAARINEVIHPDADERDEEDGREQVQLTDAPSVQPMATASDTSS